VNVNSCCSLNATIAIHALSVLPSNVKTLGFSPAHLRLTTPVLHSLQVPDCLDVKKYSAEQAETHP